VRENPTQHPHSPVDFRSLGLLPSLHEVVVENGWANVARRSPSPSDIRTWFSNVEQHATEGVNKILIGNKCDWEEKRVVSTERGQALADELGVPFLEVSAKSNINVEKAFYSLAADIKKRMIDTSKSDQAGSQGVNVADQRDSAGGGLGGKCC